MKKLFLVLSFFIFSVSAVFAQGDKINYSPSDPEKIYLFDVKINVQTDGRIKVTEDITLNAKHKEIRRGITRILPNTSKERPQSFSLLMDGKEHPFFTDTDYDYIEINFGDDNYISKGKHTYTFSYEYSGAIDSLKDYDELYWNVTGNEWAFAIDKARAEVTFPEGVEIKKDGISLYTGERGAKKQDAKQIGDLIFETTKPLAPEEGFTIAIPFEKGVIEVPQLPPATKSEPLFLMSVIKYLIWGADGDKLPPFMPALRTSEFLVTVALFIIYVLYCFISWFKKGRDPFYTGVTQFEPPKGASAAFVYYMTGGRNMSKILSCTILGLAMKHYIGIEEENGKKNKIVFTRKKIETEGLPYDEKSFMKKLRWFFRGEKSLNDTVQDFDKVIYGSVARWDLNTYSAEELIDVYDDTEYHFRTEAKKYITDAGIFKITSVCLLMIFLFLSNHIIAPDLMRPFIINLMFAIFTYLAYVAVKRSDMGKSFLPLPVSLMLVGMGFFIVIAGIFSYIDSWESLLCEIIFFIALFVHYKYVKAMENVTPEGKEFFEHLKGFEKYIKVAEIYRVEQSNPMDAEKIFCDYLPYAFALGLYNKWMGKFKKVLSKETIRKCIENTCGNERIIKRGLSENLRHFVSEARASGSSSSGGSYGGGSSGGGHGGGGGRGR